MSGHLSRIFELSDERCRELLASGSTRLGRVAFAEDNNPEWPTVLPVNYAYHDGTVYFRTFEGSKLYAALRDQRVAFEVDDVDTEWQEGWSVLAVGRLTLADDDERDAVGDRLASWAAGEAQRLVRLDVDTISGRELVGGGADVDTVDHSTS